MGAFTKLFSRLRITSDPNVATQTSAVIQADSGNTTLVIAPSGTGAIVASIPDGTATGGNARGQYSVDLQMSRSAANQVASSNYSAILGGQNNILSGTDSHCLISGGSNNNITFGSGNTISGGRSNRINGTGFASDITIVGGNGNTANGAHAVVGGQSNTSNGTHGNVVFGRLNTAGGQYTTIVGYTNNQSGQFSFVAGDGNGGYSSYATNISYHGYSYLLGQFVQGTQWAGGTYAGTFQNSVVLATRNPTLTSGATAALSLDGTGTTNLVSIPASVNNITSKSWNVTIKYTAVVTSIIGTTTGISVGDTKTQNIDIGFKRVGASSSLVGAGSYSIAQEDASMNSASLVPSSSGGGTLALTFTAPTFAGGGSITLKIIAKLELTEAGY